jgi:GNAT superfamily N-acetyltransferase
MKFVLRNANINDIEGLAVCYCNSMHDAYSDILPAEVLADLTLQKSVKKWRNEFVEQIADSDKAIFVIENEEKVIVGYSCSGAAKSRSSKAFGDGEVFLLQVDGDHQGYGLGKALMLANARWLISRGLFSGGAWLYENNIPGIRFCEELGARACGKKRKNQSGQSFNMIAMGWEDLSQVAQLEVDVPNWGRFEH